MPIVLALPELFAVLAIFLLVAISVVYKSTLGAVIFELAKVLNAVKVPTYFFGSYRPFGFLAAILTGIDNAVLNGLGKAIEANKWAFHQMLHMESSAWQYMSHALAEVAESTDRAFDYLVHHKLKVLIAVATGGLSVAVPLLEQQVKYLFKQLSHVPHALARVVYRDVPHALTKAEEAAIAALVAVPAAIAGAGRIALPGLRRIEREQSQVAKWIREHAGLLTVTGAVGLVIAALAKLGLGWTRCDKVGRLGKAVCGMDESLLESLLAGALVVASSVSIVELARECRGFTGDVDEALKFFVRELH